MVQYVLFNGALNVTVFGIQYYIWIIVVLVLLAIITYFMGWFFMWWPLEPMHRLYDCQRPFKEKYNAAFVFNLDLLMDLLTEKTAKLIFPWETVKQAKQLEPTWKETPSGHIGKVHTDLILDADFWTYPDSEQHMEIEKLTDEWNLGHPDNEIHSLIKFWDYLDKGEIKTEGNPLKTTVTVPWSRIDAAYPLDLKKAFWAGYVRQLSEKLFNTKGSDLNRYGIYILIVGGVVATVMIIVGRFFK